MPFLLLRIRVHLIGLQQRTSRAELDRRLQSCKSSRTLSLNGELPRNIEEEMLLPPVGDMIRRIVPG
ncbi:unnamed protein product [Tilletia laevis]|uniref:Uncharacterized protein n=1 Tax=Tilletia laevis TaxID=157183 RepID=A0A9N8LSC0_9BASI|nr:unnamed protein product [Tilletia laevis]